MELQKILENQKQNLRDLLMHITSGKPIDSNARKVLRRTAVGSVRLLDGCLLNAAQDREPTIKDEINYNKIYPFPSEDLKKIISANEAEIIELFKDKKEEELLPW